MWLTCRHICPFASLVQCCWNGHVGGWPLIVFSDLLACISATMRLFVDLADPVDPESVHRNGRVNMRDAELPCQYAITTCSVSFLCLVHSWWLFHSVTSKWHDIVQVRRRFGMDVTHANRRLVWMGASVWTRTILGEHQVWHITWLTT